LLHAVGVSELDIAYPRVFELLFVLHRSDISPDAAFDRQQCSKLARLFQETVGR
jgi:hypothetical protein